MSMDGQPPVDAPAGERPGTRGVGAFRLGGLHLALPMEALREVVPRGTLMPLPCRNDGVVGGVDLRGVVVPVLDLSLVLGRGPAAGAEPCVIVMVHAGRLLGLLADGVSGVFTGSPQRHAVVIDGLDESLFDCCIESDGGAMVSVLSPRALVALPHVPMVSDPESGRNAGAAAALAAPGAEASAAVTPMMLMRCGRVALAIEAIAVHATLASPTVRDSALARGACRGVIDYAGADVPVVDLLAFCGFGELASGQPRQAFLIALPVGQVAFLVDSVTDIVDTRPGDVIGLPAFALRRAELFRGVLPPTVRPGEADTTPFFVIDSTALCSCDEVVAWGSVARSGKGGEPALREAGTTNAAVAGTRHMLTYELGVETATPLDQVAEILAYAPSQAVFDGQDALLGVLVNRGRSIPVMCLSQLATGRPLASAHGASVLVVDSDGDLVGFVVPGLKAIEEARWQPALPGGSAARARPLALVGQGAEERMLPVLDLWQMARELRHGEAARAH